MAGSLAHPIASELAPAPPDLSFFRFLSENRADPLASLARLAALGGVARIQTRLLVAHLVTEPAAVQHVLQDNHRNYVKEVRSARIFRIALGEGLLLSEGEKWRTQRRLAQPAFHRQRLAQMAEAIGGAIREMMQHWEAFASSGEPFDLSAQAMRLTLDVVGRALLGDDLRPDAEVLGGAMRDSFEYFNYALNHLIAPPLFIPTARNRRMRRAVREIDRIVDHVIEHGRMRRANGAALISMLLEGYDPADRAQRMELHDNLTTFLGAGTETTAVALQWIWYLLSKHPEAERRVREEVDAVLGDREPAFDDLPRLTYTRMVIDESLRLYPPAWVISRTAISDDSIGGFHIPARSALFLSPWVTHRSRRYWDDPEAFDPERFSPRRSQGRHDYAYFPFGGGPRMCIGDRFSLIEQTMAVAMAAQKFRVRVVEDHQITPDPVFTLRPSGGLRATLSRV